VNDTKEKGRGGGGRVCWSQAPAGRGKGVGGVTRRKRGKKMRDTNKGQKEG
jgi:hypothetical protein